MINQSKKRIDWITTSLLLLTHAVGIIGTGVYAYFNGVHPLEIAVFAVLYTLTGISITAGYHRYFAHRSYESHFLLRVFYAVFGACAIQNSILRWASDHRLHHKYVDTDQDPYNIKQGGFYAHMGWIFQDRAQWTNLENAKDLQKDPVVAWQDKYYIWIGLGVGGLVPFLIGLSIGRPWGVFLWGGLLRVTLVHHSTFFINSIAHLFGDQPYSNQDTSRDNGWIALLTYGEGYHNFHHKFQADYRNAIRWYQFDPTKWLIAACEHLKLTSRLNRTPEERILSAKLEMEVLNAGQKMAKIPHHLRQKIHARLETCRTQLEAAYTQWVEAKAAHKKMTDSKANPSGETLARWKQELRIQKAKFEQARRRWIAALDAMTAGKPGLADLSIPD